MQDKREVKEMVHPLVELAWGWALSSFSNREKKYCILGGKHPQMAELHIFQIILRVQKGAMKERWVPLKVGQAILTQLYCWLPEDQSYLKQLSL